ncbi:alpha/beta hydrolase [Halosolutus gelatinilyticus]|uniref:alpha/beta hydrolase n=1 Tax=Halosolutus gelatinilyticus TaxID=2931975 RepID=UPI001FF4FE98|nr:alpha/beta fold hydrolase [Halosolutus gelatinilyticus]
MDDQQFNPDRWTARLFRDHGRRCAYEGQTGDALRTWRTAFRTDLRRALGHETIADAGVPELDPERNERERRDGYDRQRWTIRTETGLRLPFYLLVPDDADPPYPVALVAHGHGDAGKELAVGRASNEDHRRQIDEDERDMAVQAVERGYAALAPDMRGLGELSNPADAKLGYRTCHTLQLRAQLFGRSLLGDRVWDVTRLVDFVDDRDDLDADRIALTGHSGGGAVALFAAAIDDRIDVVAPSSYFCTFEDSIAAIDHCECNYLPGVLDLGEMPDVAGLVAPRPFVAVAGRDDHLFPVAGVRRAFDRLAEIYEAAGAPDRCELVVRDGGHRYYADGVWPFVDEHL